MLRLKQPGFDSTVLTHDEALLMKLTRFSPALTPDEGDEYFIVIPCQFADDVVEICKTLFSNTKINRERD